MEGCKMPTEERTVVGNDKKSERIIALENALMEGLVYIGVFLLTLVLFLVVKPLYEVQRNGAVAQAIMSVAICLIIGFIAYLGVSKRLNTRTIIIALLLLGYALRVGYMLYSPANARQQDTFSKNFDGHEAYAWTLFETGKLPTTNNYQFYHPPFNAMVQATFMKFMAGLTSVLEGIVGEGYFPDAFLKSRPAYLDAERFYLYSTCQILSVMYSVITAVTLVKIISLFGFSDKTKLLATAFVVLYPRQIQFSGMLNNDGISYMLAILALYYALRWQKGNKSLVWLLLCGGAVGFGMMSKLSSATICMPIAGLFVYEFILTIRKKKGAMSWQKTIMQYALFLLICAPIGLWFQVYAKVRFDQDFGFVFSNLNRKLYTGDHSWFARFVFPFDLSEFFGSLYCKPFSGNYWLFNYALRSSIFGEFSYWQGEGFATCAILFAYMVATLLFISMIWCVIRAVKTRKDEDGLYKKSGFVFTDVLFMVLLVLSQTLSEIYFYIKMPYGCTMDFRYIMPLILGLGLLLGMTRKMLAVEGGKTSTILNRLLFISVIAFLTTSSLFYCVCI